VTNVVGQYRYSNSVDRVEIIGQHPCISIALLYPIVQPKKLTSTNGRRKFSQTAIGSDRVMHPFENLTCTWCFNCFHAFSVVFKGPTPLPVFIIVSRYGSTLSTSRYDLVLAK
jgi:hypothetical protein